MNRRAFLEALSAMVIAAGSDAQLRSAGKLTAIPGPTSTPTAALPDGDPSLIPIPSSIPGVRQPVLPLGGSQTKEEWKFTEVPPQEFWKLNLDVSGWKNLLVPGEFGMQGFTVHPDVEYPCRRKISIPADYAGHRIFVRFDAVYSYARVWINGIYLRDHHGGFTSWDCEITEHVRPGETAELVVTVTDRSDDISQASYYAKHLIAGILRDVRIFAVSVPCLNALSASATLSPDFENGLIRLRARISSTGAEPAQLRCELTDASGKAVPLEPATMAPFEAATDHTLTVRSPKKWDAEHPNLYTLHISVLVAGKVTETFQRQIGFRSVQRVGNQLLVNGQPVKLRGVCRHSIHPVYGRAVPTSFDERDVILFREANINFVRTSHYPPTEQFLEACDRHGIYVEEETPVCWSKVVDGPSSDPAFTGRFLSQFQEMLKRDQDYACVLFWSLGNESQWGLNFAAEHSYAREHDPSRPLIISYPDSAPLRTDAYDIYSKHYAASDSSLESDVFPLLNDEFAHVSCYNMETLRRDPGVRDFWGRSIKRFGDKFLASDGCLGGAIWAGIDEVFLLPQDPVGYGPWGIIDGWRRPKPEYWLTKKAYSPIRIVDAPVANPGHGNPLMIAVTNAYDHTNLNEIKVDWSVGRESGSLRDVRVAPHDAGYLKIPARRWREGDIVDLRFSTADNTVVDQFKLRIGTEAPRLPATPETGAAAAPAIVRKGVNEITFESGDLKVKVSRETGLIDQAILKDQLLVDGGPFLDLGQGPLTSHWLLRNCDVDSTGDGFIIHTQGEAKAGSGFESIPIELVIQIESSGLITTRYRASISLAKYSHAGVSYLLPETIEALSWKRRSLWSVYPDDHIGRAQGVAFRKAKHPAAAYGSEPTWPWSEDMEDPFLGKSAAFHATNDFRSLKENIWYAACTSAGSDLRVRAEANGNVAARASVQQDGKISFSLYNHWSYPDLEWGNYMGAGSVSAVSHQEVKLRLTSQREE